MGLGWVFERNKLSKVGSECEYMKCMKCLCGCASGVGVEWGGCVSGVV